MSKYDWPVSIIESNGASHENMCFLETYIKDLEAKEVDLQDLHREHESLKAISAKQDRYIAELEKQLSLLQKTLDLIDKNGGGGDG